MIHLQAEEYTRTYLLSESWVNSVVFRGFWAKYTLKSQGVACSFGRKIILIWSGFSVTLDTGLQSLPGFRIPRAKVRIPKTRDL